MRRKSKLKIKLKNYEKNKKFHALPRFYAASEIIAMGILFFSFFFKYFMMYSVIHATMHTKIQTLCEWMQMGKEPVQSRMAPMSGPKMMTKIAFPTMCQPKAAGSFSRLEYSETVKVKLLSAMPRKNPAIQSHAIIEVSSVCSAKTEECVRICEFFAEIIQKLTWSRDRNEQNRHHEHQTFRHFGLVANRWDNNTSQNVGESWNTEAISRVCLGESQVGQEKRRHHFEIHLSDVEDRKPEENVEINDVFEQADVHECRESPPKWLLLRLSHFQAHVRLDEVRTRKLLGEVGFWHFEGRVEGIAVERRSDVSVDTANMWFHLFLIFVTGLWTGKSKEKGEKLRKVDTKLEKLLNKIK